MLIALSYPQLCKMYSRDNQYTKLEKVFLEKKNNNKIFVTKKRKITWKEKKNNRNLPNDCVSTAGGVQETELNTQTKLCSVKCGKYFKVSDSLWQWAEYIMVSVFMKFH